MKRQVVLTAAAGAMVLACALPAQAQKAVRSVIVSTAPSEDVFVRDATQANDVEPATAPSTGPTTVATTGPTSKPARRIDAFLKVKFARTPQSVLTALSAKPDPKAKEADRFAQDVVAGRWEAVAKVIATFDEKDDAKKLYKYVISE
ncbi:MAG: hypothetical protein QOF78_4406, partial [Phycisphaerales bacterium]|nr:hypothetical protein [Phycisphaerales bacterium]